MAKRNNGREQWAQETIARPLTAREIDEARKAIAFHARDGVGKLTADQILIARLLAKLDT